MYLNYLLNPGSLLISPQMAPWWGTAHYSVIHQWNPQSDDQVRSLYVQKVKSVRTHWHSELRPFLKSPHVLSNWHQSTCLNSHSTQNDVPLFSNGWVKMTALLQSPQCGGQLGFEAYSTVAFCHKSLQTRESLKRLRSYCNMLLSKTLVIRLFLQPKVMFG